jgi:hypothetical protein
MLTDFDPSERWEEHGAYLGHVAKARQDLAALTKHLHEHYPDFDLAESDKGACRKWGMLSAGPSGKSRKCGDPPRVTRPALPPKLRETNVRWK